MNRYTRRTFGLELLMVAVALVVAFPVYVLVNLAVRPPSNTSSPLRPTLAPTLDNFTQAWQQGGLFEDRAFVRVRSWITPSRT